MLKGLTTKFFAVVLLSCLIFTTSASALEISAFESEKDSEATITFCKIFKIENVSLSEGSVVRTVIFEKDDGEFENIALLNNEIANKIIAGFEGVLSTRTACNKIPYTLISTKKVKDKNLVIAKVSFDSDISTTFLVSSYQKGNKTLYRVTTPQDFRFINKKYKNNFRNWLIKETKDLL